jgi:hypothetical protein
MDYNEAVATWQAHLPEMEMRGIVLPNVRMYVPDEWKHNSALAMDTLAMDAQPQLALDPSSALPVMLTSMIDPETTRILFTPNKAINILGEEKRGDWTMDVMFFPVIEPTGEVSSYGDYNNNGRAGVNATWPQRQQYLYQVIMEYGERELDRAALGKINLATEIRNAAATVMNKFRNYVYFFGVQGLQNYGLLNDPSLSAPITPSTKAAGGTAWVDTTTGQPKATPNEVYADIQALFYQLVKQTGGLVQQDTPMLLTLGTKAGVGLTNANSFAVNVNKLLEDNFPNLKVETAVQYNALGAGDTQGFAGGNFAQLWALEIDGQRTGFAAYSEMMREHPIIRHMSSFRQKASGGVWGAVIRVPMAVASIVGI